MAKKRTRREMQKICYLVIVGLVGFAWFSSHARAWALPMLAWVAYEVLLCPTRCGVHNKSDGLPCSNPVLGRWNACHVGDHPRKKFLAILAMVGVRKASPGHRVFHGSTTQSLSQMAPDPLDRPTMEPHQRTMLYLTIIGTIGTVVQAVTGLIP